MKKQLKAIPKFATEEEERKFWEHPAPSASAGFHQSCGERTRCALPIAD
jgi:hypothetical protein